mmetsp:Transcript_21780/g.46017  ORF Transcript_21780/g.46017 Transcript_21780/m.46017 type:complete len:234 (+) Transcript_21780:150-851(+)
MQYSTKSQQLVAHARKLQERAVATPGARTLFAQEPKKIGCARVTAVSTCSSTLAILRLGAIRKIRRSTHRIPRPASFPKPAFCAKCRRQPLPQPHPPRLTLDHEHHRRGSHPRQTCLPDRSGCLWHLDCAPRTLLCAVSACASRSPRAFPCRRRRRCRCRRCRQRQRCGCRCGCNYRRSVAACASPWPPSSQRVSLHAAAPCASCNAASRRNLGRGGASPVPACARRAQRTQS